MIPDVEESLAAVREALIPQLQSSSIVPLRGIVLAHGRKMIAKIGPRRNLTTVAAGLGIKKSATPSGRQSSS
ncbi:hypothetical protein PanWU01x14_321920 [Parasponia andersonii]|uniref:Uncharacterized protein n=1 Tax=Parasponia andersonii TaxID=3476 RepID=A0A2P5AL13_PARAD|nr:hypothetical protein PanWU01x14_321920 [Parasponia andersonii]